MKKNLVALLCFLTCLLIITSCSNGTTTAPTTTAPPASPVAADVIELKFSSWVPPQSLAGEIIDKWIEEVHQATGGKVHITHYAGATLGANEDHYNMVLSRQADIILSGGTTGIMPASEIATLPFLFKSAEEAGYVQWKLAEKYLMDTDFKKVKYLYGISVAPDNLLNNRKQVRTMEDMKGLKLATGSDMAIKGLEALGATATYMPPTEMYTSIERGLVDGEMANWEKAFAFKESDVTKYRTTGINAWVFVMCVFMNLDAWNSLPADVQKTIDDVSGLKYNLSTGAIMDETDAQFLQMIIEQDKEKGNPEVYYLPEEERARWAEATATVRDNWVAEMEAKGIPGKQMLEDAYALVKEFQEQKK